MKPQFTFLIFLFSALICDTGCGNPDKKTRIGKDYERVLFNGYRVFRANSSQVSIVDGSRNIIVGPSVTQYSHQDPLIFGEVDTSNWELISDEPGFFLLNTKSGSVEKGLEKAEWIRSLRKVGIENVPRLREP
jgi:hypothetical protein